MRTIGKLFWMVGGVMMAAGLWGAADTQPATRTETAKKPTLAVLPFIPASSDAKEKDLAERMRFAVSQKLSTDANAVAANGAYDRLDNVQVDQLISALEINFGPPPATPPDADDMQKLLGTLETQFTIAGTVKSRTLTLQLYEGGKLAKTATVEIPPDNQSPKLAVEKVLTELTGTTFAHIRSVEADHSDAKAEARFAANPNLVSDPDFSMAAGDAKKAAVNWEAILGPNHYAPPLLAGPPANASSLEMNHAAIVPIAAAKATGGNTGAAQFCLMMRINKEVAENNGLAVESTWIPVEQNKKYRFSVQYHSTGPVPRLFLKGFAYNPDQYGNKDDPEAARREYYRAQVLPRRANAGWELIEMDFTPSTLKPTDPKIQWLRVDLYIYLQPGDVFFTNAVVKKIDE